MTAEPVTAEPVIVVFGAAVWPGGRPSGAMRRRVEGALLAANQHPLAPILASGGVGRHPPSEAQLMHDLLVEAGITDSRILLDPVSTTTLASVVNTTKVLSRRFAGASVMVCTDRYHQPRCIWLYRLAGIDAKRCPVASCRSATGLRRWLFYQLREALAFPWTTIQLLLHRWFGLGIRGTAG